MNTKYLIRVIFLASLISSIVIMTAYLMYIPPYLNVNECWYDDGDGNILPCKIDTDIMSYWWPSHPPTPPPPRDLSNCDDMCHESFEDNLDA